VFDYLFKPGEVIDKRFEVVAGLGGGGMGRVMLVQDLKTKGRPERALKYCLDGGEEISRRFSREVRFMGKVAHPNVMAVLHSNPDHNPPYFVMPVAAGSLASEVDSLKADERRALDAFRQMCLGIQAVHKAGGTHRDIKPENAMRMRDGVVVVSDLGLAKLDPRDTTVLTQAYCAPEQLIPGGSRDADARTDVYQLGKSLYRLVTGEHPGFVDPTKVPPALAHVIKRATREHPDDRYPNVAALIAAVDAYLGAQDPNANPGRTLEALIKQAEESPFSDDDLIVVATKICTTFLLLKDEPEEVAIWFEKLPTNLLTALAELLPAEFEPVVRLYSDAVVEFAGDRGYSYAEVVAEKMKTVFRATASIEIKSLALRAVLVAAVKLNRYAAMDVFDGLLLSVDTGEAATAIAEMLEDNLEHYGWLASRITASKLQPRIHAVQKKALEGKKKD
jgi:eukaryotic-like serine/threonine-protein kinase